MFGVVKLCCGLLLLLCCDYINDVDDVVDVQLSVSLLLLRCCCVILMLLVVVLSSVVYKVCINV